MTKPKTLLELAGADLSPPKLLTACLLIIDMQNEYLEGPLKLPNANEAIESASELLSAARNCGTPVIHVAHAGRAGGLFDRSAPRGEIVSELASLQNETVIEKQLPNAFSGTNLHETLVSLGNPELVICGFMTHMCVSSTARAALDLGIRVTICSQSCATRDLPDGEGGVIAADMLHKAALVELSDRFAIIARNHKW